MTSTPMSSPYPLMAEGRQVVTEWLAFCSEVSITEKDRLVLECLIVCAILAGGSKQAAKIKAVVKNTILEILEEYGENLEECGR